MVSKPTAIINRLFKGRAAKVGACRFFNNKKVTYQSMIDGHVKKLSSLATGKNLLVVQDTGQYNFSNHEGIIKDSELGFLAGNRSIGLHVHPSLVMDLDQQDLALGYSDFQIINREIKGADRHERKYQSQSLEEK